MTSEKKSDKPGDKRTEDHTEKRTTKNAITKDDVITSLKKCLDPEIHLDVWTLGLIYEITLDKTIVKIIMTFTTPFCPYGPLLIEDIKTQIHEDHPHVTDVEVDVVFEPPWTPTPELKLQLGIL